MKMSTPIKPTTTATIKIDGVPIGLGLVTKSSLNFTMDTDEFYGIGDEGEPTVFPGHRHYKGSFEKAWINHEYLDDALAGAAVEIEFSPDGSKKLTVTGAYLNIVNFVMDEDKVVLENLSFVGSGITPT
jgi:hypothetical protein